MTNNSANKVASQGVDRKVSQNSLTYYAKWFGKDSNIDLPLDKDTANKATDKEESASNYNKNRNLLAKVFIIWSIILMALLFNVLGVL